MEIYFKPHPNRLQEQIFFRFIQANLKDATHISEDFSLQSQLIENLLSRDKIIAALDSDKLLSQRKKDVCISELKKLPNEIRIAEGMSSMSVDIVIRDKKNTYYIEFHEPQHRRLPDKRLKPIFSKDLEEFRIPRLLQRFLRDVWRWQYLDNYKVFWFDWFEQNQKTQIDFTTEGKSEFYLSGKFSYEKFLN